MLHASPGDGVRRPPATPMRDARWLRPDAAVHWRPDAHDARYWSGPSGADGAAPRPARPRAPTCVGGAAAGKAVADPAASARSGAGASALLRLRAAITGLRVSALLVRLSLHGGFKPDQPRVPAGNPDGGQWTATGGVSGSAGSSGPRGGHHYVPRGVYEKYPLQPQTAAVFRNDVTGELKGQLHRWSKAHERYNAAVREQFDRFLERNHVAAEDLTPDQARAFSAEVKRSSDPRIRDFNKRIWMREIIYILRRGPRRAD